MFWTQEGAKKSKPIRWVRVRCCRTYGSSVYRTVRIELRNGDDEETNLYGSGPEDTKTPVENDTVSEEVENRDEEDIFDAGNGYGSGFETGGRDSDRGQNVPPPDGTVAEEVARTYRVRVPEPYPAPVENLGAVPSQTPASRNRVPSTNTFRAK